MPYMTEAFLFILFIENHLMCRQCEEAVVGNVSLAFTLSSHISDTDGRVNNKQWG